MKNLIKLNKIYLISFAILLSFFLYSQKIISSENVIIFKLKDKAFTKLDFELRLEYLDFVGNNLELDKETIINDLISANLFFEYYKDINNKNEYDEKADEIFEKILEINKNNNKIYKYKINKKNILHNIKLDFIRKTILERIINSNIDDLNKSDEELDLLYNIKIKYINFSLYNSDNLKNKIKNLINPKLEEVINILNKNNINYFSKEKEINNISKVNFNIRNKILKNEDFFYVENQNKISLIFIEKKFETYEGIVANLYSFRTDKDISETKLKCSKLKENKNKFTINNKDYNFVDLNNQLKKNLVDINDYIKIIDNNENVYIILCDIKFDKKKLNNININKLINLNVNNIEKRFINKYSKVYNLIVNEF